MHFQVHARPLVPHRTTAAPGLRVGRLSMHGCLRHQGVPLDAESIAAGMVADAVDAGRLSLEVVDERLGAIAGLLVRDLLRVRGLPQCCDVYNDVATGALRELCLNYYDARCAADRAPRACPSAAPGCLPQHWILIHSCQWVQ